MLFMAEMEVALPADMDPAAVDELKARAPIWKPFKSRRRPAS